MLPLCVTSAACHMAIICHTMILQWFLAPGLKVGRCFVAGCHGIQVSRLLVHYYVLCWPHNRRMAVTHAGCCGTCAGGFTDRSASLKHLASYGGVNWCTAHLCCCQSSCTLLEATAASLLQLMSSRVLPRGASRQRLACLFTVVTLQVEMGSLGAPLDTGNWNKTIYKTVRLVHATHVTQSPAFASAATTKRLHIGCT
jgi:hypothetical protein